MSSFHQLPSTGGASLLARLTPLAALILPFLASIALLSTSHLRVLGSRREDIDNYRTAVSIVVQVLSGALGILQVSALTGVISASFRLRLATRPMQLDTIGLLNAAIVPRIPTSLPLRSLLLAALMVVLGQAPGALWAGALTTVTTTAVRELGSVVVPLYTSATADVWDSEFQLRSGDVWNLVLNCITVHGGGNLTSTTAVSNCPVPNYQAQLLVSAREASTGGSPAARNHSKPDSAEWTYHGRSYGVGAAQGLAAVQEVPAAHSLLSYAYNETGYRTSVECEVNATASIGLALSRRVDNVDIWEIEGTLPNSIASEFYPVMAWHRDSLNDAAVLAWVGVSNNDSHMFAVLASEVYGNFSNVQCTVAFQPSLFTVNVNSTTQTINVSVVDVGKALVDDVDQSGTGHLRSNAIRSLNLLSRMSTSLYISILGDALDHNLQTVSSTLEGDDVAALALVAAADSFTAMLDDVLGIYGGSQLVLAEKATGQRAASISGEFAAYRFGQPRYQWAVLGVNVALLLLIVVQGVQTRWWRGLPCFDTLDFESVVAASSSAILDGSGPWRLQRANEGGRRVMIKATGHGLSYELRDKAGTKKGSYQVLHSASMV